MLKKLDTNAYRLQLHSELQFNYIFNVEDIHTYQGHDEDTDVGSKTISLLAKTQPQEIIEDILNDQVMST